ncbi:1,4-dihydroxy-2-naphthoate polyprenyltransferase [Alicyclobacillus contaminans]|uniref:1,4-dihydroxy-2-naphthoate polyprenyltransferase n=1 Tax=Alicyclobacillus contaminans TaxID=392016 RepID=UPI0003FCAA3E|nr:1,4-dihydroxy-2-naphthoate polyprenyltransferase [Alicyclobacillus contaminans]
MTLRSQFSVWWRLLRPFTLTASLVPVLIGTGLAVSENQFRPSLFICFLLASILIQSATNMFNEYYDYRRGLDDHNMVGIAGTIVRDGVHPKVVLRLAWLFVALAVLLGVYICAATSWWVAVVGILCLCVAYCYSGGPVPLAYTPFGELAAAVAMGPVIVLLAYYVETGKITGDAFITSIPIGLLIGALLLGNNIRDMEQDRAGGRRTLVILLGRDAGRILFATVFAITYLIVLVLVILGVLTAWELLVLLTVPTAAYVVKQYYRYTEPKQLHPAMKGISVLLLRFGALMFVGFLCSTFLSFR